MWPTSQRSHTFFRGPELPHESGRVAPRVPRPAPWKALLGYSGLVFFSAFLALFMAEATDPLRGFLPFVVEPPPGRSVPRGFEASLGVSQLYPRRSESAEKVLVANLGDHYRYAPQEGIASWYGYDHLGRKTADGGWFDPEAMTAAHRTLPFGTIVRVIRLDDGRSVDVTVNDRGPYLEGRIIDLARRPASELGLYDQGVTSCRVEVLKYPAKRVAPPGGRQIDVAHKTADPRMKELLAGGTGQAPSTAEVSDDFLR